jgi:hypothetical protein
MLTDKQSMFYIATIVFVRLTMHNAGFSDKPIDSTPKMRRTRIGANSGSRPLCSQIGHRAAAMPTLGIPKIKMGSTRTGGRGVRKKRLNPDYFSAAMRTFCAAGL